MPLLLPTSSFKTTTTFFIAGVFSVAAAVTFTVPSVSHFAVSCFPTIYDNTIFLLKPPYLYLVINCIIVSIVATSKFTHKSSPVDVSDFSVVLTPVTVIPVPTHIDTGYLNITSNYTVFVENDTPVNPTVEDVPDVIVGGNLTLDDGENKQTETDKLKPSSDSPDKLKPISDSPDKLKPISDSPEKEKQKNDSPEISILKQSRKPPKFGQQKSLKLNREGGGNKKTALGVTKPPRKQDTLESTWKKITEGRSTPLTKHLTKSDTWQERTHVQSASEQKKEIMTKSENLNDINTPTQEEETQKTRLNREPSPGQEELNRRVEAFIKKFNEEMRLQRLESLAKYNEMVNGGTRL